jgi:hypothetical protein
MRTKQIVLIGIMTTLLLSICASGGQTQGTGPVVLIVEGTPDAATEPPKVRTCVSVIDKSTAQTIEGLTANDFQVKEDGKAVRIKTVSYEPVGLAVVVVVDRGRISAPHDPRISEVTDLVGELVSRLSVTGADADDMIAIVGVGRYGVLQPEENFSSPVDTNLILNALPTMGRETVRGETPLYEGLDEAIRLLTDNPDEAISDVLPQRRKIIVVFSDGVDPDFSDEAREGDTISRARERGISIYAIGMAQRNEQLSDEGSLLRLAVQTDGLYTLHNDDETHQQALDVFDRLMTQRYHYLVTYDTYRLMGTYELNIAVDTPIGLAERNITFSSILEATQLVLTSPTDGLRVTVPYSRTLEGFVPTHVELEVEIRSLDGFERNPAAVHYFANGERIGTRRTPPAFHFAWNLSTFVAPTGETQKQSFRLTAEADDGHLGERMESKPVTIEVEWEATEYTSRQRALMWLRQNWWLLLILAILAVGSLVLLVQFIRMRSKLVTDELPGPIANPYVAGNPVTGDLFVGRKDILRRLEELWRGEGQKPSVVLYGHRRMGKSSILYNLGTRFGAQTVVVDFNIQRVGLVASTGELLYNLALALYDAQQTLGVETPRVLDEPDVARFTADNPYTAFDRFLKQLDRVRADRRFIVTVDEFELIERMITGGQLEPRLLDFWRGLIQTYPWFVMAFAGLHTLQEMTQNYWHPLFGSVTAILVSFLSHGAAWRLITRPTPDFALALGYDDDAVERIIALTHGQPYLVQLIGHGLVTRFNRQAFEEGVERERRFSLADVEAVIRTREFYRDGDAYFTGVWWQAETSEPPGQTVVLRALAQSEVGMPAEEVARQAGLALEEVGRALETLARHDVVMEEDGRWQFTVELMRRWVARR